MWVELLQGCAEPSEERMRVDQAGVDEGDEGGEVDVRAVELEVGLELPFVREPVKALHEGGAEAAEERATFHLC